MPINLCLTDEWTPDILLYNMCIWWQYLLCFWCHKRFFHKIIFLVTNSLGILGLMRAELWGLIQVEWPVLISPLCSPIWEGPGWVQCCQIHSPVKPHRNVGVFCIITWIKYGIGHFLIWEHISLTWSHYIYNNSRIWGNLNIMLSFGI